MSTNSSIHEYTIDSAHSSAQFSVRHMMISNVRGEFRKVTGAIRFDPSNPEASSLEAHIEIESIDTREPARDTHLKSADFFDAANFPHMSFRSTSVKKAGDGLDVQGELTMRGISREVVLHVEEIPAETKDPWGLLRIGASATAKVNRKDWGLEWNQALETGGVVVGNEVKITLEVEATRSAEAA